MDPSQTWLQRAWANAYLLMVLTTLVWGANAVASRLAVDQISPIALTALRWAGACAVMLPLVRGELRRHWPVLRARWRLACLLGMGGLSGFTVLMYLAAHSTSAINIGILQGSTPIFVLMGAFVAFRTPISRMQGIGVAITLVGVAVIASRGDIDVLMALRFVPGDFLMILACLFNAGLAVGLRLRPPVPGMVYFTALAGFACLAALPPLAAEIALGRFSMPTPLGWLIVAFTVIFPSLLSQLTFLRAIDLIGPGRAGVFVNLVPVFASILAVLILGEPFGLYHAAALVLVLGGIFIAENRIPFGRRKPS
ncbi:DMT family transporter [Bosea sp. (in: a-proteobacteria)]|uniref:DMT family transporter n=1 Tax=Bosea sp. (in: a-proteobacteria) TaxID=1871050 RepID=UPI002624CC33|nr:DMT family transporter [Bosea sp. (in: a-proteobacteria)]MCO5091421.1 DMT family transporter [Bosea sp. (in: a-proteobacteria)]